jgi:hypothetical protein
LRRDAEANRQKILAAADRLISERGLGVAAGWNIVSPFEGCAFWRQRRTA